MNIFSKDNIYIMLFLAIGIAYVIFLVYQNLYANQKEGFEEPVNDKQYKSNLQVIKVFDVVLNRKPTNEELDKYGKIDNEQDILIAVMNDFKNKKDVKDIETKPIDKEQLTESKPPPVPEKKTEESDDEAPVAPSGIAGAFKEAYDNVVNDDRVCMKKSDVIEMLTNISEQVKSFKSMVNNKQSI